MDWVTEGWQALTAAEARQGAGEGRVLVHVRAYQRERNGRQEHVSDYVQYRARREGEPGSQQARTAGEQAPPAERPAAPLPGWPRRHSGRWRSSWAGRGIACSNLSKASSEASGGPILAFKPTILPMTRAGGFAT